MSKGMSQGDQRAAAGDTDLLEEKKKDEGDPLSVDNIDEDDDDNDGDVDDKVEATDEGGNDISSNGKRSAYPHDGCEQGADGTAKMASGLGRSGDDGGSLAAATTQPGVGGTSIGAQPAGANTNAEPFQAAPPSTPVAASGVGRGVGGSVGVGLGVGGGHEYYSAQSKEQSAPRRPTRPTTATTTSADLRQMTSPTAGGYAGPFPGGDGRHRSGGVAKMGAVDGKQVQQLGGIGGETRREEASGSISSDACSGSEEYRNYGQLFLLYLAPQIEINPNLPEKEQFALVKRAMANRSGIKLGQYALPFIGKGSFGIVGIVRRKKDKKLAAIKFCNNVSNLDCAKREVDIQRYLFENGGEKFITKIYDAFTAENKLVITMELGTCGSLKDFIESRDESGSCLSEAESREVLRQTFMALEHVHGAGVVHFDIKPANVLVCYESPLVIKLADFGSSKYIADVITVPNSGIIPMYAAPELLTDDGILNQNANFDVGHVRAVDVFGAGSVAVDCVVGTIPKRDKMEHFALRERRKANAVAKYPAMGPFLSKVCSEDPTARPTASATVCLPWLLQNVDQPSSTLELEKLRNENASLRFRLAPYEKEVQAISIYDEDFSMKRSTFVSDDAFVKDVERYGKLFAFGIMFEKVFGTYYDLSKSLYRCAPVDKENEPPVGVGRAISSSDARNSESEEEEDLVPLSQQVMVWKQQFGTKRDGAKAAKSKASAPAASVPSNVQERKKRGRAKAAKSKASAPAASVPSNAPNKSDAVITFLKKIESWCKTKKEGGCNSGSQHMTATLKKKEGPRVGKMYHGDVDGYREKRILPIKDDESMRRQKWRREAGEVAMAIRKELEASVLDKTSDRKEAAQIIRNVIASVFDSVAPFEDTSELCRQCTCVVLLELYEHQRIRCESEVANAPVDD